MLVGFSQLDNLYISIYIIEVGKKSDIMKKNNNIKKGFTLVELLVVIAILAILAVVSVVGYTSFTKKAKISNDIGLTTQLNTILQANETTDGANKYPHEAALELVDGGYDVTKITPTTEKYNYVYDLSQNRMFLLDESYNVVAPSDLTLSDDKVSIFGFAGSQAEVTEFNNHGYSVYLKSTYDSDSVTTNAGADVGDSNITLLNYTNEETAKKVIIRTNSEKTTLTINAKLDTIKHYNVCGIVDVVKIANASYHEYGNVEFIGNSSGRVVIENGADVKTIVLKGSDDSSAPVATLQNLGGEIKNKYAATEAIAKANNADKNNVQFNTNYCKEDNNPGDVLTTGSATATEIESAIAQKIDEVATSASSSTFSKDNPSAVARILNNPYSSLSDAIKYAKKGDIVILLKDVTESKDINITCGIQLVGTNLGTDTNPCYPTINGAGYNNGNNDWTGKSGIVIDLGNITSEEEVAIKNLKLMNMGNYGAIEVSSNNSKYVNVKIDNVYCDTFYRMGISVHGGNVDINDCIIDSHIIMYSVGNGINFDGDKLNGSYTIKGSVANTTVTNSSKETDKWSSGGICLWGSVDLSVDNCNILNTTTAVASVAETANKLLIKNTCVSNAKIGLEIDKYSGWSNNSCTSEIILGEGNNFNCSSCAIYAGIGQKYKNIIKLNINGGTYSSSTISLCLSDKIVNGNYDNYNLNDYLIEGSSISTNTKFDGDIQIEYCDAKSSVYEAEQYNVQILNDAGIKPNKVK